jgi:hypothetical protein
VQKPRSSKKAESILDDFENAVSKDISFLLSLDLEKLADEIRPLHATVTLNFHPTREFVEFFDWFVFEFRDVQVRLTAVAGRRWGRGCWYWPWFDDLLRLRIVALTTIVPGVVIISSVTAVSRRTIVSTGTIASMSISARAWRRRDRQPRLCHLIESSRCCFGLILGRDRLKFRFGGRMSGLNLLWWRRLGDGFSEWLNHWVSSWNSLTDGCFRSGSFSDG